MWQHFTKQVYESGYLLMVFSLPTPLISLPCRTFRKFSGVTSYTKNIAQLSMLLVTRYAEQTVRAYNTGSLHEARPYTITDI